MKVLFFARIREQLGEDGLELDTPLTIASLRTYMQERFPNHKSLFGQEYALVAVNQEIETCESRELMNSDEVAFLPPMTGG